MDRLREVSQLLLAATLEIGVGQPARDTATLVAAAGLVYLVGCFGVTVVFNVPMNEALAGMDLSQEATRTYWSGTYVPRWTFWNTVRTVACGVAAALLLVALTSLSPARPA